MAKLSKKIEENKDLKATDVLDVDDETMEAEIKKKKRIGAIAIFAVFAIAAVITILILVNKKNSDISNGKFYNKDLGKYVKLGDYKNVKYTPIDTEVTDEEVEAQYQTIIDNKTTYTELPDRMGTAVENGDIVFCKYVANFDGKEIENRSGRFEIGSNQFTEFEKAILGKNIGEIVKVSAQIPEDYEGELEDCKGKVVVFDVNIEYALQKNIPVVDDEFVSNQTAGECKKADEFKAYIASEIKADKEDKAKNEITTEIISAIVSKAKFTNINKAVDSIYKQIHKNFEQMAEKVNMSFDEYIESFLNKPVNQFEKELKETVTDIVKEQLVLMEIANKEKLVVKKDSKYYKDNINRYIEEYQVSSEEELLEAYKENDILESMTYDKVVEYLLKNAKAK